MKWNEMKPHRHPSDGAPRRKPHHQQIRPSPPLFFFLLLLLLSGISFLLLSSFRPDGDGDSISVRNLPGVQHQNPAVGGEDEKPRTCATVEEMGETYFRGGSATGSLRVRRLIRSHFHLHGAASIRDLPSDHFCKQGFVMGKASEAGFGNEMYKILSAAALSVMLNRSLIIGQTRGKFPFEEYISYANISFTLKEVKHLWRKNKCIQKFGRPLKMRIDDFGRPSQTNVLCSDWRTWKEPIIWFKGATDAIGSQFFLKNIHPGMRNAALSLFGPPESLKSRPNVFGELLSLIISPSETIKEAIHWALGGGAEPDLAIHMRMLSNRPVRAMHAVLSCVKKALNHYQSLISQPRIVLISDTPSFAKDLTPNLSYFAEVIHFDYNSYLETLTTEDMKAQDEFGFRVKDWGPAPRWVAFVDFFLASRAKFAIISGAHRRVGTTYSQLAAMLAAANNLVEDQVESPTTPSFAFFSSFQGNLLVGGLAGQIGWGHVWNRFAGPLSCRRQPHQCAFTPLLPPAWWDAHWQSPISRDIRRLQDYGVKLTDDGKVVESSLQSYCTSRKESVRTTTIIGKCSNSKCV